MLTHGHGLPDIAQPPGNCMRAMIIDGLPVGFRVTAVRDGIHKPTIAFRGTRIGIRDDRDQAHEMRLQ